MARVRFLKGALHVPSLRWHLSASQNDFQPGGVTFVEVAVLILRTLGGTSRSISGFAGGEDGRILFVLNEGTATIDLLHESSSSAAANRLDLYSNNNQTIGPAIGLIYNGARQRWQQFSRGA